MTTSAIGLISPDEVRTVSDPAKQVLDLDELDDELDSLGADDGPPHDAGGLLLGQVQLLTVVPLKLIQ